MPIEHNDFNDERLSNIRAEQDDPIIQYYIVRTDLEMSAGKIGAQIAHGAQMFILKYYELLLKTKLHANDNHVSIGIAVHQFLEQYNHTKFVEEWLSGSFRKVVLGGKKKDFEKIIFELQVFQVRDAGLTEVAPNSETVLVTWPIKKSECPKCLTRLQILK